MSAEMEAERIIGELRYNFTAFSMGGFLRFVGEAKGRELILIPWTMPTTLFGAWISDGEEAKEYIFYRDNLTSIHQIHIQLHELSHFLLGHPTLRINGQFISDVLDGTTRLSLADLPQLRSPRSADFEAEAETLANLIQKKAIQYYRLDRLIHDASPEEKLIAFLKKMSMP